MSDSTNMSEPVSILVRLRDWLLRLYCRLLLLLALYVFSIGPMYWVCYEAFYLNGSTYIAQLYWPVAVACQENEQVANWVNWYVEIWIM